MATVFHNMATGPPRRADTEHEKKSRRRVGHNHRLRIENPSVGICGISAPRTDLTSMLVGDLCLSQLATPLAAVKQKSRLNAREWTYQMHRSRKC